MIVLNWNGINDTIECLDSLEKVTYHNFSILLIDNASTDGSVEIIKENYSTVDILQLDQNYGFSGGLNKGIEYLKKDNPDFVVFMNNDIIVSEIFLDKLIDGVKEKGANNIFSPIIYYSNNKNNIWYAGGLIRLWYGRIFHPGIRKHKNNYKINHYQLTDYVTGCCMLISWKLIRKLNGFDEKFNMYAEDVDLCLRAKKMGSICYVNKKSEIWHKVSRSVGGHWSWKKNIKKFNSIYKLINIHSNSIKKISGILGLLFITIFSIPKIIINKIKNYNTYG